MRPIDADKLIEEMRKWYWDEEKQKVAENDISPMDLFTNLAITTVKEQPTAFDVKKVIEQLNKELELADEEKRRCTIENMLQFDEVKGYARGMACAIEIVKRGGVDEE